MFIYFMQRLGLAFTLMMGVLMLVFFMVRVTGDPVSLMLSREATDEQRAAFRAEYGLDRPLIIQMFDYLAGVARGDLGMSLRISRPNLELILQRLPATFELAFAALLISLCIALPLGVLAGQQPGSFADGLARTVGLLGQTVPSFVLAIMLILLFAVRLRWLPSFGRDGLESLILPAFALSLATAGQLTRLTRSVIMEIRSEAYIRTARAKGLSARQVATRHLLPNAAIPLISVIGIQFTYLLGGSVYIETIFSWPGLGSLLNTAISDSDFPLVQAITIFIAFFAIAMHLVTDVLYGWIDPRLRMSHG